MDSFGQAMEEVSSTSEKNELGVLPWCRANPATLEGPPLGGLTKRSMLEGERHNVLDTFERICEVVSRESLCNNKFYAAKIISSIPIALRQQLFVEGRKLQFLELALFVEVYC